MSIDINQKQNTITKTFEESSAIAQFFDNCKNIVGEETFNKWFSDLKVFSFGVSEIIISASSKFTRDWVNREFFSNRFFFNSLKKIYPQLHKISAIHVSNNELKKSENSDSEINFESSSDKKIINLSKHDNVFAYGTELNNRFTFNSFIPTKHNKIALKMAKIVAGSDEAPKLFDDKIPLYIHGAVGMGKTHLAQAIAWNIKENDKSKKVVYLSAEKFMFHFVQSIRGNDVMLFKEKMRSIDVLIVDDMQFIAGKDSTQQEFMNCFNSLVEDNKQVVLVCDRCPNDLENIDEKLKSRITGGMIVNFRTPDFSDRLIILKGKSEMMNFELSDEILNFIAQNITGSVRDLEGALKKLFAEKMLGEQELNLHLAKNILASYVRNNANNSLTVEKIQKIVAEFYEIKISEMTSNSRIRVFARARQMAMFFSKLNTSESLQSIGEKFSGKNHATVIHAVKTISELQNKCSKTANEIKILEEKIRG